jgi:hypothetical protein
MVFYGRIRISADERRRGTTDPLALARLEDAFGDAFGGSVALVDIEQLATYR